MDVLSASEVDPIERVVDYVASMDPPFSRVIRGVGEDEIDRLQDLIGTELPPIYRSFLAHMGRDMDWISIYGSRFDIDSVRGFYLEPGWPVPPQHILVARPTSEGVDEFYLRLDPSKPDRVVGFSRPYDGEVDRQSVEPIAGSLEEMIGSSAYQTMFMAVQPFSGRHFHNDPAVGSPWQVARLVSPLGFTREWFSNDWTTVCTAEDAGLIARKGDNSVLVVDVAAKTAEAQARVVLVLERELGLTRLPIDLF